MVSKCLYIKVPYDMEMIKEEKKLKFCLRQKKIIDTYDIFHDAKK